jgi:hypothetical protein
MSVAGTAALNRTGAGLGVGRDTGAEVPNRGATFSAESFVRLDGAAFWAARGEGLSATRTEFAPFPIIAAAFRTGIFHPGCRQVFSEVAQALACDALNQQPPIGLRMIHQTSLNRILPNVFEFLFQLRRVPYDVVESLITPDGTGSLEQSVYLAGRSAFNKLKHLAQPVWLDESKD